MSKPKWHKGSPPSIGWWPASIGHSVDITTKHRKKLIRWWDGQFWSVAAFPDFTAAEAADCVCFKAPGQNLIEWSERWWL